MKILQIYFYIYYYLEKMKYLSMFGIIAAEFDLSGMQKSRIEQKIRSILILYLKNSRLVIQYENMKPLLVP